MKISTWYPAITSWFNGCLAPVTLNLLEPQSIHETNLVVPPFTETTLAANNLERSYQMAFNQQVFYQCRFSNTLKYSGLPMAGLEALHATVNYALVQNCLSIVAAPSDTANNLTNLTINPLPQPVQVAPSADSLEDWVCTVGWSFNVQLFLTPDVFTVGDIGGAFGAGGTNGGLGGVIPQYLPYQLRQLFVTAYESYPEKPPSESNPYTADSQFKVVPSGVIPEQVPPPSTYPPGNPDEVPSTIP